MPFRDASTVAAALARENIVVDENLLSPCGLYCGVCGIRTAYLSGKSSFIAAMAKTYGVKPEQIKCDGCRSNSPFILCATCPIKSCAEERNLVGCHECSEWPCDNVRDFSFVPARGEMMRAIPLWRELGTEKWIEYEMKYFSCKECGAQLFRGVRRCRNCNTEWSS
jgi:hypothetical protein